MALLSVIVPCYNESEALHPFMEELERVLDTLTDIQTEVIFVNDGSKDDTLQVMEKLAATHPRVRYLSFSRNFGKGPAFYRIRSCWSRCCTNVRTTGWCRAFSLW